MGETGGNCRQQRRGDVFSTTVQSYHTHRPNVPAPFVHSKCSDCDVIKQNAHDLADEGWGRRAVAGRCLQTCSINARHEHGRTPATRPKRTQPIDKKQNNRRKARAKSRATLRRLANKKTSKSRSIDKKKRHGTSGHAPLKDQK